jgi:hypothetical protein
MDMDEMLVMEVVESLPSIGMYISIVNLILVLVMLFGNMTKRPLLFWPYLLYKVSLFTVLQYKRLIEWCLDNLHHHTDWNYNFTRCDHAHFDVYASIAGNRSSRRKTIGFIHVGVVDSTRIPNCYWNLL